MRTVAVILLFGAAVFLSAAADEKGAKKTGAAKEPIPAYFKSAEAAKPYPKTLAPETFQHPAQVKSYAAARRIPGVLAQQPCYCHCDRMGHGSLLHCHIDSHSAG
jgi:hypothetical protein